MAPSLPFLTGRSLVRPLKKGRVSLDFYDEKRRLKEELRKSDLNPLSPVAGSRGTPLKKHHTQTYLAIVWFSILVTYVILIEYCVHAHNLPLDIQYKADDGVTFGQRGTSTRRTVVQAFTVIRTILTAAHVPIMTGTLAATLPALTQRVKGKNPLKLTASQLFLLADRSWGGAGGWYEAFLVGKLPWYEEICLITSC